MTKKPSSIDDLIAVFVTELLKQEEVKASGGSARVANRHHDAAWKAQKTLFDLYGDAGREALAAQLHHESRNVRVKVAALLLRYKHHEAMSVLKALAADDNRDNCWLGANLTIQRWNDGEWALDPAPELLEADAARLRELRDAKDADRRISLLLADFVFHTLEKRREMDSAGYAIGRSKAAKENFRHYQALEWSQTELLDTYQEAGIAALSSLLAHDHPYVRAMAASFLCQGKITTDEVRQQLEALTQSDDARAAAIAEETLRTARKKKKFRT